MEARCAVESERGREGRGVGGREVEPEMEVDAAGMAVAGLFVLEAP